MFHRPHRLYHILNSNLQHSAGSYPRLRTSAIWILGLSRLPVRRFRNVCQRASQKLASQLRLNTAATLTRSQESSTIFVTYVQGGRAQRPLVTSWASGRRERPTQLRNTGKALWRAGGAGLAVASGLSGAWRRLNGIAQSRLSPACVMIQEKGNGGHTGPFN